MFKGILYRFVARRYLLRRSKIASETLKSETQALLQNFHEKLESLNSEQLDNHSIDGKWSASEIAFHAINSCKQMLRKCDVMRSGQTVPDLQRSDMGRTKNVSKDDLIKLSKQVQEQAAQYDFHHSSTIEASHPVFGKLKVRQWLVMNLIHLERHLRQLERIIQH